MDVEVTEEIVIAKPVACRLNFSSFRSFSKSLSSSNDASPPPPDIPQAAGAVVIKPITMRFRPNCNRDVPKAGILNSADCHLSKIVHESSPKNNVYKPIVKLASRAAAISSSANLGDQCHGIIPTREIVEIASGTLKSNQVYSSSKILETQKQPITNFAAVPNDGDTPSSAQDHHSWRKYGQKSVKESEYPRSYYKCTYPNCPVKKKVDKMSDDHIEEEMVYVYDGEHNHTICQIPCHPIPDKKTRNITTQSETKIQSDSASSSESTAQPTGDPVIKTGTATTGVVGECEEVSEYVDAEGDDLQSKRSRGKKNRLSEASISGVSSAEPQKNLVPDNNDEFRWRKYGQKVVKGNLYARSYYKCTNPKCSARKYVERTPKDPGTFITTYEGRHDHGILISGTNLDKRKMNTRKKS